MLGWLRRRRAWAAWIDAEAEALIRHLGIEAYSDARRREREANSIKEAREWNRVALAIARKTCRRVGFDTSTRMASDAIFASFLGSSTLPPRAPIPELDPLDELVRLVSEDTGRGYRIQFLGPGSDQTQTVLAEVEVRASDVSTAMREAAHTPWPPRAIGFRLVDHDGRAVLGRQEGSRST